MADSRPKKSTPKRRGPRPVKRGVTPAPPLDPEAAADAGRGRQTRSYLMQMMEVNGLRPKRQLGQNFLIDLNLLDLLVRTAEILPTDVVLEIGAGTGGLTNRLAAAAARVVSVEIDPGFYQLASHETAALHHVRLLHTDALAGKNRMTPEVLEAVQAAMADMGQPDYLLVANLPYDVAASVIGNLLLEPLPVRRMVFTVQKEMGERIVAQPGSKDYGPLSVLCQRVGKAELIRILPPHAFWPRPKIESAILRIDIDPARRTDLADLSATHRFVRGLFLHRRKTLRSAIAHVPGYKALKSQLDDLLASLGLEGTGRAEALGPERLHDLFVALRQAGGGSVSEDELDAADADTPEDAADSDVL